MNLRATASRSSGIPAAGVYLVNPSWIARIAASRTCAGVSKSGSPAPNETTSTPAAFIALARPMIRIVADSRR